MGTLATIQLTLIHSMPVLPSYRNQSIDLHNKFSMRATLAFNVLKDKYRRDSDSKITKNHYFVNYSEQA